ncbi:MAG: thiamine diphosphokinase [Candidatus Sumerlaeota bacterium]
MDDRAHGFWKEDNMTTSRVAWICCNGALEHFDRARAMLVSGEWIIAADGGMRHLRAMSLRPNLLIGDMDSIGSGDWEQAEDAERLVYPPDKDRSDSELAVEWAIEQGADQICLMAATGGRLDHTLGHAAMILRYPGKVCIHEPETFATGLAAGQSLSLRSSRSATVSIFSFEKETMISNDGLLFAMEREVLRWATHGLSNRPEADHFSITVHSGSVLLTVEGAQTWIKR